MTFNEPEDLPADILAKAMAGRSVGYRELANLIGADPAGLRGIREGRIAEPLVEPISAALGLKAEALRAQVTRHEPPPDPLPHHIHRHTSPFHGLTTNAYVHRAKETVFLVDTGTDAGPILADLDGRCPDALLLTHAHQDHVAALPGLREAFPGLRVLAPRAEPIDGAELIDPADTPLRIGKLAIRPLPTAGHSPGGTSFFLADESVCYCGDALFAGSVGGCAGDYEGALDRVRRHLLGLPPGTVLLPGHGPATTVEAEIRNNPFFP